LQNYEKIQKPPSYANANQDTVNSFLILPGGGGRAVDLGKEADLTGLTSASRGRYFKHDLVRFI